MSHENETKRLVNVMASAIMTDQIPEVIFNYLGGLSDMKLLCFAVECPVENWQPTPEENKRIGWAVFEEIRRLTNGSDDDRRKSPFYELFSKDEDGETKCWVGEVPISAMRQDERSGFVLELGLIVKDADGNDVDVDIDELDSWTACVVPVADDSVCIIMQWKIVDEEPTVLRLA